MERKPAVCSYRWAFEIPRQIEPRPGEWQSLTASSVPGGSGSVSPTRPRRALSRRAIQVSGQTLGSVGPPRWAATRAAVSHRPYWTIRDNRARSCTAGKTTRSVLGSLKNQGRGQLLPGCRCSWSAARGSEQRPFPVTSPRKPDLRPASTLDSVQIARSLLASTVVRRLPQGLVMIRASFRKKSRPKNLIRASFRKKSRPQNLIRASFRKKWRPKNLIRASFRNQILPQNLIRASFRARCSPRARSERRFEK
jgi:hypothetical protein